MGGVNYSSQEFDELENQETPKAEATDQTTEDVAQLIDQIEANLQKIKKILLIGAE